MDKNTLLKTIAAVWLFFRRLDRVVAYLPHAVALQEKRSLPVPASRWMIAL